MSTATVLRDQLREVRASGATGARKVQAFEDYARAAAVEGTLDPLRRFTTDEVERFWAFTIPGVDGHVYWDGPEAFTRNDGRTRRPRRWIWERRHGTSLSPYVSVVAACGERNCITHLEIDPTRNHRKLYRDEQIIGAIQVAAMRLGHAPSLRDWDRLGLKPVNAIIYSRFGTWTNAIRAAGLVPLSAGGSKTKHTDENVLAGVRALAADLGRIPTSDDYRKAGRRLVAEGYASEKTVYRRFGTWQNVLRQAGLK